MMNLLNSPKTSHTFLNNLSMNLKCAWGDMRRGGRKRGEKKKKPRKFSVNFAKANGLLPHAESFKTCYKTRNRECMKWGHVISVIRDGRERLTLTTCFNKG